MTCVSMTYAHGLLGMLTWNVDHLSMKQYEIKRQSVVIGKSKQRK